MPNYAGERALPKWSFWNPGHRDQQGHDLSLMCLSGFSPGWWDLKQDCVLGSLNPTVGAQGLEKYLEEGMMATGAGGHWAVGQGRKQASLESPSYRGTGLSRDLN